MSLSDIEKKVIEKYTMGTELVTDVDEAVNMLRIHGEECEKAIHSSIREKAYRDYKKKT